MSEGTTIIDILEGRPCWLCLDLGADRWVEGMVLTAWFEASHEDDDDDEDDEDDDGWRVYPTLLVCTNLTGEQWILQLPAPADIRFCERPLPSWVVGYAKIE